ncbi:hypothetical protein CRUP_016278, partial [Coryphaenoides rupestris]
RAAGLRLLSSGGRDAVVGGAAAAVRPPPPPDPSDPRSLGSSVGGGGGKQARLRASVVESREQEEQEQEEEDDGWRRLLSPMHGGLLKHTPSSSTAAASSSSDQNSSNAQQTTLPTIPRGQLVIGPKDQLRLVSPVGAVTATTNHIVVSMAGHASPRHSGGRRDSEEEDGGGGGRAGARVKKKRKKKDKREKEKGEERESRKPKKRREEREREREVETAPPPPPRRWKEGRKEGRKEGWKEGRKASQRVADRKDPNQAPVKVPAKRGRKPKIKIIPPAPPPDVESAVMTLPTLVVSTKPGAHPRIQTSLAPAKSQQRPTGHAPPVPRPAPKKKKGKRRSQEVLPPEGMESDDAASVSTVTLGGDDSQDPLDHTKRRSGRQVKRRKYNEDLDFKVWAMLDELEKDPRIHQKIKRFRTKHAQMKHLFTEPDEDLFNPDYVEADRILEVAITTDTETGEEVTHYLVKWCSLSYEESTWELQEDLDASKIKEFEEIQKIPSDLRYIERPLPDKWQKLEHSRGYRGANQLREYQLEGMNWLLFNWYHRKNCILADEMGLGKTIQSITFLYEMFSLGIRGPFLVIAPLSTITNWEREFRSWTPLNVIVYHGSQISRHMILQYEMFYRDAQFHGVITTFEMIMADCPELKKLHWRCVVIDEAHRLKNRNCKLLEGLKMMNLEHKVLLTGTPLQKLGGGTFPSESSFLEEFGDLKTEEQVKKLQAILKPMMLRRLKDDVEKNLAPKEETIIEVELTNIQKKYYRAILEKNFSFLKSHSPDAWDFQLQAMIQGAGKLVLIDKLLPKLLAGGHKVLVFSQMVRCLDILEDYLIQRR